MSQIYLSFLLFGQQLLYFIVIVVWSWSPVQFFVFRLTINHGLSHFRILKLTTSIKTLPTDKFTFALPGIRTWTYLLGEGLYSNHYPSQIGTSVTSFSLGSRSTLPTPYHTSPSSGCRRISQAQVQTNIYHFFLLLIILNFLLWWMAHHLSSLTS